MKSITLSLTVTLLLISNAFAISAKDNWTAIRFNRDVMILHPEFARAMGNDGVFNTCATEETFRSINPVRVCKEFREVKKIVSEKYYPEAASYIEYRCVDWKNENIEVSRTVERDSRDSEEVQLPGTINLEVVHGKGQLYMHHIMMKAFTIPDCM